MALKLAYDDEQLALQASIEGFCARAGTGPLFTLEDPLPAGFWDGLAELGVLGLGTVRGGGGALEIAAAMETLGARGAPGPLVGTFTAAAVLADDEIDAVAHGAVLVSVGQAGLFPWAPQAGIFFEAVSDTLFRVDVDDGFEVVDTTGNEPWGRCRPTRRTEVDGAPGALARADVAIAAYVVGAAQELLDLGADYARDRVQFKKPIATFQAVSHPLAVASMQVNASRVLTRGAAQKLDAGADDAASAAATARLSAVASATAAAYQAHQLYGAMGFTQEGPVAHLSHRIRHAGLLPPEQSRARDLVLQSLDL